MSRPGCHHNCFVATPELGHRMYGYTLWGTIALRSHQSKIYNMYHNVQSYMHYFQSKLVRNL